MIRDTYSTLQNLQTYYQIGDVDVDRYLDRRQGATGPDRRARAQQRRPPVAVVREPPHRLHARLRRGGVAEQQRRGRRRPELPPARRPGARRTASRWTPARRRRSTSPRTSSSYVLTGAEQAEFNYQTRRRDRPVHALQGQGRREAVQLRAPGRVRAALRQPRPVDLGPDQLQHQAADGARHPRPGHQARAVPRSSTPTRTRWCSANGPSGSWTATRRPTCIPTGSRSAARVRCRRRSTTCATR